MARGALSAAVVLALIACASAAPLKFISIFGDSFMDDGNAKKVLDLPRPPEYGWRGRFSDGPTFIDVATSKIPSAFVRNVAWGGATACTLGFSPYIPNLATQVMIWNSTEPEALLPAERLSVVFIGHNDVLIQLQLLEANQTTAENAFGYLATNVPTCIAGGVKALLDRGEKDIVVLTLAPMQLGPFLYGANPLLVAGVKNIIDTMNQLIVAQVMQLQAAYPAAKISVFDMNAAVLKYFARAEKDELGYKASNQRGCLILDGASMSATLRVLKKCTRPNQFFFYDTAHPTHRTHSLLAVDVLAFLKANGYY